MNVMSKSTLEMKNIRILLPNIRTLYCDTWKNLARKYPIKNLPNIEKSNAHNVNPWVSASRHQPEEHSRG